MLKALVLAFWIGKLDNVPNAPARTRYPFKSGGAEDAAAANSLEQNAIGSPSRAVSRGYIAPGFVGIGRGLVR